MNILKVGLNYVELICFNIKIPENFVSLIWGGGSDIHLLKEGKIQQLKQPNFSCLHYSEGITFPTQLYLLLYLFLVILQYLFMWFIFTTVNSQVG